MARWRVPGGTTATFAGQVLDAREIAFNITTGRMLTGDGATAGGLELAFLSDVEDAAAAQTAVVSTLTALKAADGGFVGSVHVRGKTAIGDGGEGAWDWHPSSTATGDDILVATPDAGGTGRWKRRSKRAIVDLWYGIAASIDGTTDNTTAMAAMAAKAIATGRPLYSPGVGGAARIVSNLALTGSLIWEGDGEGTVIKHKASTADDMIEITGAGHKITLRDMVLDGNQANQTAQSSNITVSCTADGGTAPDSNVVRFQNVEFRNGALRDISVYGDESASTREFVSIEGCRFYDGAQANNGANYNPADIGVADGAEVQVIGCEAESASASTGRGFVFVGQTELVTQSFSKVTIKDNVISRRGTNITQGIGAIDVYFWGDAVVIDGNRFENSVYVPIKGKANGKAVSITNNKLLGAPSGVPLLSWNNTTDNAAGDQLLIADNQFRGALSAAACAVNGSEDDAFTDYTKNVVIARNQFVACDSVLIDIDYCKNVTVDGNECDGGTIGIDIQNSDGRAEITNNRLTGQSNYSIYNDNNAATYDSYVGANVVQGNTKTGYAVLLEGRVVTVTDLEIDGCYWGLSTGPVTTLTLDGIVITNPVNTLGVAPGVAGGSTLGTVIIRNCDIVGAVASSVGVSLAGVTATTVIIEDCNSVGNITGFSVASATIGTLVMKGNKALGATTPFNNGSATITTYDMEPTNSWVQLSGSATFNPADLADGAGETTTVTVTGAALGDYVIGLSFSLDLQSLILTGYVSAADTVSVRFQHEVSGGNINLGSGTLRALVRKRY